MKVARKWQESGKKARGWRAWGGDEHIDSQRTVPCVVRPAVPATMHAQLLAEGARAAHHRHDPDQTAERAVGSRPLSALNHALTSHNFGCAKAGVHDLVGYRTS